MITAFISSCEQPEVGYISDHIHAQQNNQTVPRGVFFVAPTPLTEGTTSPIEWTITSVTDKDGNITNALQEEKEMLTWIKPFDPRTDTTMELALKKLKLTKQPSVILNPESGQFQFTPITKLVVGDDFDINMKAKNVRGERQLDKFMHVTLTPFIPVKFPNTTRFCLQFGKAGNVWEFDTGLVPPVTTPPTPAAVMTNPSDYQLTAAATADQAKVLDGTSNKITILKKDVEPKMSIKVKMIITDSFGTPINPSKIVFFPDATSTAVPQPMLPNYHENSIGAVVESDGIVFGLPAPPFPQYSSKYTNPTDINRFLMYYLSLDGVTFDKAAYEAANPIPSGGWAKFWTPYTDPATGLVRTRIYMRWGIGIDDTGTWELKMKIPYCKAK